MPIKGTAPRTAPSRAPASPTCSPTPSTSPRRRTPPLPTTPIGAPLQRHVVRQPHRCGTLGNRSCRSRRADSRCPGLHPHAGGRRGDVRHLSAALELFCIPAIVYSGQIGPHAPISARGLGGHYGSHHASRSCGCRDVYGHDSACRLQLAVAGARRRGCREHRRARASRERAHARATRYHGRW